MTNGAHSSDPQLGQAPRRRRRVLLISLGSLCLIVVGALAIGFGIKGKDKNNEAPTAAEREPISSLADITDALTPTAPDSAPITAPATVVEPVKAPASTASESKPSDLTITTKEDESDKLISFGDGERNFIGPLFGALPGAAAVNGAFNTLAASAASLAGLQVCYPETGSELKAMVESGSSCSVVILKKGSSYIYLLPSTVMVTSSVIILGHPIDPPQIHPEKGVYRLFDVAAGSHIDIRFVSLFRPALRNVGGNRSLIVAGCVLVRTGGYFRGSGVIFRQQAQTFEGFVKGLMDPLAPKRIVGGFVLVAGGAFFCYGCQIIRWAPYGAPNINLVEVGRDYLVLAGTSVCIGCYHVACAPFQSSINVGNAVGVLGGVGIRVGGGTIGTAVLKGQFGAGENLFVGGGVLVNVGHQQQTAFVCLNRANFGMTAVGSGVMVLIAELENRAWGVAAITGAGQVYSNGAGVLDKTGGEVVNCAISFFQALAGGSVYLGTGDMNMVGEQFGRVSVTLDQNGVGMTFFNGAGQTSLIYVPSFVAAVVRSQKILGAEGFLGAGFFTNVNNTRWSIQVVNAGIPGYEGWVGLGAALFVRSRTTVRRVVNFRFNPYAWVVNGQGVPGSAYRENNIFVNKDGIRINKPNPSKSRLLAAVDEMVDGHLKSKRNTQGLLAGIKDFVDRPAIVMANSEMDSARMRPPDPQILAGKILSMVTSLKHKRRLQGQAVVNPTRMMNMFAGLSPAKLMEAWKEATEETNRNPLLSLVQGNSRALAETADPTAVDENGRWAEQVYVGGKETQCVMCGVGPGPSSSHWSTGGNDTATCHVTEECTSRSSFRDILAAAKNALPQNEELVLPPVAKGVAKALGSTDLAPKYTRRILQMMEEHQEANPGAEPKLPDHNILAYELSLYCGADDADCSFNQADMKAAVKLFLGEQADEESAFNVAASTTDVHPALIDYVKEASSEFLDSVKAPSHGSGCGKGLKFNVQMTAPDAASVKDLQKIFEGVASNGESLLDTINKYDERDVPFCDVKVSKPSTLFFPSIDTAQGIKFYQGLFTGNVLDKGSLWPDVTLVSPHEVAPVQHAVVGQPYTVLLENFAMKGDVVVELFQGTEKKGVTVATVPGGIAPGEVREVSWTAPEPLDGVSGNRAYLRAYHAGMPAIYSESDLFDLLPSSVLEN